MNKSELQAQISALEEALTAKGVTFTKADTSGTNTELEKEIERLELLIDDEGDTGGDGQSDGQTDVEEVKRVLITKGVNVQIRENGVKKVLKGGETYELSVERATSLVAEKHGEFVDD